MPGDRVREGGDGQEPLQVNILLPVTARRRKPSGNGVSVMQIVRYLVLTPFKHRHASQEETQTPTVTTYVPIKMRVRQKQNGIKVIGLNHFLPILKRRP